MDSFSEILPCCIYSLFSMSASFILCFTAAFTSKFKKTCLTLTVKQQCYSDVVSSSRKRHSKAEQAMLWRDCDPWIIPCLSRYNSEIPAACGEPILKRSKNAKKKRRWKKKLCPDPNPLCCRYWESCLQWSRTWEWS